MGKSEHSAAEAAATLERRTAELRARITELETGIADLQARKNSNLFGIPD
jgi:phage shock protein A